MQQPDIPTLAGILEAAGRDILLPPFERLGAPDSEAKADGSVVTETDLACQARVREQLEQIWPAIGFLGEEMEPDEQQRCLQQGGRFWCLDPLDGTSNFVAGFPAFGLSLALMNGGTPELACIVDPVRGETFSAVRGQGAALNGRRLAPRAGDGLGTAVGYIDFKRLDADRRQTLSTPGHYRSQRNIGSCALEWAWLAAGRGQFIVHGGEKIWDFAAGGLIAIEAGCHVSDFAGSPLFDGLRSASSVVAGTSEGIHKALLDLLADQPAADGTSF